MMEIIREDWDRVLKQVEGQARSEALTTKINAHVIAFIKEEIKKCPTPTTKKADEKSIKSSKN